MQAIEKKYPHLFRAEIWSSGPTTVHFRVFSSPPPERLISNVNFVPFVDDRCVIIRLDSGKWEIPGGTLEPSEHYLDTIRRELMEEAGATILTHHVVGGWECISSSPKPYREHLPHPRFFRLVLCGQVQIVGVPTNPENAERVSSVERVSVKEAADRFSGIGRNDLAELYLLASENSRHIRR